MKKSERFRYLALTLVPFPAGGTVCICAFCRYAAWEGECEDTYPRCLHPLSDRALYKVIEFVLEGFGADCWGFRPAKGMDIPTADGMVANWLQGNDVILE